MDLKQKVAVVTGGIGNIGFSTVQQFLRSGTKYTALFDLPKADSPVVTEHLKKLENEFGKERFDYYECNVTNKKEFSDCYEKVLQDKEYIDILVNNAGVCNEANPDLTLAVNLNAVITGTFMAIDGMGTNNRQGVVVNIGSIFGLVSCPVCPTYSASKHGVVAFVRSMKTYGTKPGVRVLCICPHLTATNMTTYDNLRNSILPQVSDEVLRKIADNQQKVENVSSAIVDIIQRGNNGDVWLVQNDEPAFNVGSEDDVNKMRIPF